MRNGFEFLPDEASGQWKRLHNDEPVWSLTPLERLCRQEQDTQDKMLWQKLFGALADMPNRARYVLERRVGLRGSPASFVTIAKELGVSKQRVGQMWHAGIRQLRLEFTGSGGGVS